MNMTITEHVQYSYQLMQRFLLTVYNFIT